jgi:hypothetical protein
MTEADYLSCTDPARLLGYLLNSGQASDRKLRLFSCACARRLWPWLVQERSRQAVEVAERYAEGLATLEDMARAWREATLATPDMQRWSRKQVAAHEVAVASVFFEAAEVVGSVAAWAVQAAKGKQAERAALCDILRDLFGPLPFRGVPAAGSWRARRVALAETIHGQRSFDRLPGLGPVW